MLIGKMESFAKLYLDLGTCIVFTQLMQWIILYWKHVSYHVIFAYCTNAIGGSCPWILKSLEPYGPTNKACDIDSDHTRVRGNGDDLTFDILLEDNFITNAEVGNKENCKWWVLQCTQPLHTLTQVMRPNGFGNCFGAEFDLLIGRYYKQQGRNL